MLKIYQKTIIELTMKVNQSINNIHASALLYPIELHNIVTTDNGEGGTTTEFELAKTVYAGIVDKQYSKRLADDQINYTKASIFYVRYDTSINYNQIIVHSNVQYIIHSIVNIANRDEFYEILAYTKNENG